MLISDLLQLVLPSVIYLTITQFVITSMLIIIIIIYNTVSKYRVNSIIRQPPNSRHMLNTVQSVFQLKVQ